MQPYNSNQHLLSCCYSNASASIHHFLALIASRIQSDQGHSIVLSVWQLDKYLGDPVAGWRIEVPPENYAIPTTFGTSRPTLPRMLRNLTGPSRRRLEFPFIVTFSALTEGHDYSPGCFQDNWSFGREDPGPPLSAIDVVFRRLTAHPDGVGLSLEKAPDLVLGE